MDIGLGGILLTVIAVSSGQTVTGLSSSTEFSCCFV